MAGTVVETGGGPLPGAVSDPARLRAVRDSGLLDSDPEPAFDELADLAARLLEAPLAFVTVVDEQRSFWKAAVGATPGVRQNAVQESFCQYVIEDQAGVAVEDAGASPRTRANPSVALLGVQAWAGQPLRDGAGHVLGSFCVADTRARSWTSEQLDLLTALAGAASAQVALRAELAQARRHAEDLLRLQLAQEASGVGLWDWDLATGTVRWDDNHASIAGIPRQDFGGTLQAFLDLVHPEDRQQVREQAEAAAAAGGGIQVEYRVQRPDGGHRHVVARGRTVTLPEPYHGAAEHGGQPQAGRMVGAVVDVTALRDAAADRARSAERLAQLTSVALELADAETVDDLTRIVIVRGLAVLGADGGAVSVRDDERAVVDLAISDTLGTGAQIAYSQLPLTSRLPAAFVARTGQTVLLPTLDSTLEWTPEFAEVHATTGRRAWATLPLRSSQRLLGALVVGFTEEQRFGPADVELLAGFAAQCGQALERLQAKQAQREAAAASEQLSQALQRSLLTQAAQPEALELAVRYVPAAEQAQVGGDWHDSFSTTDGTTVIVIGDVNGHDRTAAASMGQVRNLLRGLAVDSGDGPARLLQRLDCALTALRLDILATAVLARLEPPSPDGTRTVRWSSAGHLPPVHLQARDARLLDQQPDLMLGVLPELTRTEHTLALQPGDTVVLYTDGLVERRGTDLDDGLRQLLDAAQAGGPPGVLCDHLLQALAPAGSDDDIAILVVRNSASGPPTHP